jgi:ankyrin repeat protein
MNFSPTTPRSVLVAMFSGYPEHMAVLNDDTAALIAALESPDGDPCARHHEEACTPLSLALVLNRTAHVEILLNAGAFANSSKDEQRNAVCVAAQCANERVMQMLIDANCDLSVLDVVRATVCHFAAYNPNAAVLSLLLKLGVPCDSEDFAMRRPIHNAAGNSNEQVLQLLLSAGCDVLAADADADRGLCIEAAQNSNEKVIKMLISAGANPHRKCISCFPIHVAASNENEKVVEALIAADVDLEVLDSSSLTACARACSNPNVKVLDALLAAGARFSDHMFLPGSFSVAHLAVKNNSDDVLKRIIGLRYDVNRRNANNRTPLHDAALLGTPGMVTMLLAAGARLELNQYGGSVCCDAAWNASGDVMRVLIAAGADFVGGADQLNSPVRIAIANGLWGPMFALHQAGIDVVEHVNANMPALLRLMLRGDRADLAKALFFLFRHGVNIPYDDGRLLRQDMCADALTVLFALGADLKDMTSHSTEKLVTMIAAGANIDTDSIVAAASLPRDRHHDFRLESAFTIACVPLPTATVMPSLPPRLVNWARHCVAARQFELLRWRALEVCIGLQTLDLPALITCEILANVFAPRELFVPFHRVWQLVTNVKHFRDAGK